MQGLPDCPGHPRIPPRLLEIQCLPACPGPPRFPGTDPPRLPEVQGLPDCPNYRASPVALHNGLLDCPKNRASPMVLSRVPPRLSFFPNALTTGPHRWHKVQGLPGCLGCGSSWIALSARPPRLPITAFPIARSEGHPWLQVALCARLHRFLAAQVFPGSPNTLPARML